MKIIMLMATSLDGFIAQDASQISTAWTSSADKKFFVTQTKEHGVVIFGNTTYQTFNRPLPGRLNLILTSSPEKYQDQTQPDLLEFIKASPEELITNLATRGFESAILGGGAKTNAGFLQAKLVDEIIINIHPIIFGSGIKVTDNLGVPLKLELIDQTNIGDDTISLRYKVLYD